MYRPVFLILIFVLISATVNGQKVLWASEVLEFSSERKTPIHLMQIHGSGHKAIEVLHEPNIFPGSGGSTRAWTPRKPDKPDYIKVGFAEAIHVQQIAIAETFNATAVWKVFLYDTRGREYLVDEFKPRPIPLKGRILDIYIEKTPYKIKAVKVVLNGAAVPGYNGIDAIAISDSRDPIEVSIPVAEGIYNAVVARRLSSNINSPYKDLKPLLSTDNNTLYFSRVHDPANVGGEEDLEDVWVSKKDENGQWQQATNFRMLNNEGPNFISSITPIRGGEAFVLGNRYRKKRMIPGASVVHMLDSGISDIEPLFIENEENFSPFANFFMGANQNVLLMSVQRRGSIGGRDLYVSFLKENGKWSTPKNLGETINTPDEDFAPFLALDGKTLYFSSKGHLGFGGSDIYVSRRLDDSWTNWSEPENLGPSVNSTQDDMFFILASDHKYAYYTRGDGEDADIYYLELPVYQLPEPVVTINVDVLNSKDSTRIPNARLSVLNAKNQHEVLHQNGDETGSFSVILPNGKTYEITASAEDFLSVESHIIDLGHVYETDTVNYTIYLTPVEKGIRVPLNDIYFEFNKAVLKSESFPQLEKIQGFMAQNKNVKIQVDGHTCSIGRENYNQDLSERRARSVMSYLVDSGIKQKRIVSLGYGELKPKASNTTEHGRKQNRRVEFVILSD